MAEYNENYIDTVNANYFQPQGQIIEKTITDQHLALDLEFDTKNTYLDKNIYFRTNMSVVDAVHGVSSEVENFTPVYKIKAENDSVALGTISSVRPDAKYYLSMQLKNTIFPANLNYNVDKAGWIEKGSTSYEVEIPIEPITAYVPIQAGHIETAVAAINMSTYFEELDSEEGSTVILNPAYKATEGYIDSTQSFVNNGGMSYWRIKSGNITTATKNQITSNPVYDDYVNNTTAIVPAEGSLIIGEGYYPNTRIDLSTLIPDDTRYSNASSSNILYGYEAYDSTGKKLIGTIPTYTLDSNPYYTSSISEGKSDSAIVGNRYYKGETKYIKAGKMEVSADNTSFKSVIQADPDALLDGKINITTDFNETGSEITEPYYAAFKTSADKAGTISIDADVTTAGWFDVGTHHIDAELKGEEVQTVYMNIPEGKIDIIGGNLTALNSTTISASNAIVSEENKSGIAVYGTSGEIYCSPMTYATVSQGWVASQNGLIQNSQEGKSLPSEQVTGYLESVTLVPPTDGYHTLVINDPICSWTLTVDNEGNVIIM